MANTTNVITSIGFGAENLSVSKTEIVGDYFQENNTVFPTSGEVEYTTDTIPPLFEQDTNVLAPSQESTSTSSSKSSGPYIWKYQ